MEALVTALLLLVGLVVGATAVLTVATWIAAIVNWID